MLSAPFQRFMVGCGCLPIARGGSWKNWRWEAACSLAVMGATVVGEQVWENDSPIPCLLESSKGIWEHNPL